jgi:hypothetical protein
VLEIAETRDFDKREALILFIIKQKENEIYEDIRHFTLHPDVIAL